MFHQEFQILLRLTYSNTCKHKNTAFINILVIYSHYGQGDQILMGATFFWSPPVYELLFGNGLEVGTYCKSEIHCLLFLLHLMCKKVPFIFLNIIHSLIYFLYLIDSRAK